MGLFKRKYEILYFIEWFVPVIKKIESINFTIRFKMQINICFRMFCLVKLITHTYIPEIIKFQESKRTFDISYTIHVPNNDTTN